MLVSVAVSGLTEVTAVPTTARLKSAVLRDMAEAEKKSIGLSAYRASEDYSLESLGINLPHLA